MVEQFRDLILEGMVNQKLLYLDDTTKIKGGELTITDFGREMFEILQYFAEGKDGSGIQHYKNLIHSAELVQEYIIDSEMEGHLDKTDSFYTCYTSLDDLLDKFKDEMEMS